MAQAFAPLPSTDLLLSLPDFTPVGFQLFIHHMLAVDQGTGYTTVNRTELIMYSCEAASHQRGKAAHAIVQPLEDGGRRIIASSGHMVNSMFVLHYRVRPYVPKEEGAAGKIAQWLKVYTTFGKT